jgi:hypothetical protein
MAERPADMSALDRAILELMTIRFVTRRRSMRA